MSDFKEKIFSIVKSIPYGETMSYGEVARKAGFPNAARAVGTLMKSNYDPEIPCHRVIRSDGSVGEYNRGSENKIKILLDEGAEIKRP